MFLPFFGNIIIYRRFFVKLPLELKLFQKSCSRANKDVITFCRARKTGDQLKVPGGIMKREIRLAAGCFSWLGSRFPPLNDLSQWAFRVCYFYFYLANWRRSEHTISAKSVVDEKKPGFCQGEKNSKEEKSAHT